MRRAGFWRTMADRIDQRLQVASRIAFSVVAMVAGIVLGFRNGVVLGSAVAGLAVLCVLATAWFVLYVRKHAPD